MNKVSSGLSKLQRFYRHFHPGGPKSPPPPPPFRTPKKPAWDRVKLYFRSDINNKNKRICQVHDIINYKEVLGNYICEKLLFVHSFTGCDTTSSFYGIGKGTALKYFIKSDDFQNIVSL